MLYRFCVELLRILLVFAFRIRYTGKENVPQNGGFILAVNHKSAFDPVMAALACPRQLSFMAKAELFKNKLFGGLISKLGAFPVHRGAGDVNALKTAFKILKSGGAMLIFPEGRRVKNGEKRHAKTGVAMIAQKMAVPVIPVHIDGDYKWMSKITVRVGEPIDFAQHKGEKLSQEEIQALADNVLETIYSLKG